MVSLFTVFCNCEHAKCILIFRCFQFSLIVLQLLAYVLYFCSFRTMLPNQAPCCSCIF
uniref:Uncharacterized protein n=1 Tax=Anguilla anguilla TaxID=7936 RepID=A0A0E9QTA1_ANGAN